jgi:C-terminal processing protease CtpA/Prc
MSALKAAGFFCPPDKLPEVPELKGTKRFFKLPVVILTSGKTRNSSEIFVSVMEKAGSAMTIGYPTAGMIFSVKAVETSSLQLLVPISVKNLRITADRYSRQYGKSFRR